MIVSLQYIILRLGHYVLQNNNYQIVIIFVFFASSLDSIYDIYFCIN